MLSHVHDDSSSPAEWSREDVVDDNDSDVKINDQGSSRGSQLVVAAGVQFQTAFEAGSPLGLKTISHIAIDTSLTKLFECMTLAYRLEIIHTPGERVEKFTMSAMLNYACDTCDWFEELQASRA